MSVMICCESFKPTFPSSATKKWNIEKGGSFVWNQDWISVRKNPMWHVWLLLLQCVH